MLIVNSKEIEDTRNIRRFTFAKGKYRASLYRNYIVKERASCKYLEATFETQNMNKDIDNALFGDFEFLADFYRELEKMVLNKKYSTDEYNNYYFVFRDNINTNIVSKNNLLVVKIDPKDCFSDLKKKIKFIDYIRTLIKERKNLEGNLQIKITLQKDLNFNENKIIKPLIDCYVCALEEKTPLNRRGFLKPKDHLITKIIICTSDNEDTLIECF